MSVLSSVALPVPLPASFWSDVDRLALCVHRPSGASAEFRRVVERISMPAGSFVVSAARHIAAGRVTLEQLQLLGRYESRSIVAANAKRHVELGFFREVGDGIFTPRVDFRAASLLVLDLQARAADELWAGTEDLEALASTAATVVATVAPSVPAPAFAAQRADHEVTPPAHGGQLLACTTELRYLRSDLHAQALAAHGLSGPTARAVDRIWKGHQPAADDLRRLEGKQLVKRVAAGWALRDGVRRAREEAQAESEHLSAVAFDPTPAGARQSLIEGLARLPGDDPRPASDR